MSPLRPRLLLQLAILFTVILTVWLTLHPRAALSSPSSSLHSSSSFRSLEHSSTLVKQPILLEASDRTSVISTKPAWRFTKPKDQLKPCDKIFVFTFMPWWGFASEYILYIRAMSMADKLGYQFLPDDSQWNYGRLSSYFAQVPLSCIPPIDWDDHRKAYPIFQGKSWQYDKKGRPRKRLRYSRAFLSNLDDWTRTTYFDEDEAKQIELEALRIEDAGHRRDKDRWILEEGGTLPSVFEDIFNDHARAVKKTWILNDELQKEVNDLGKRAGLREEKRLEGDPGGRGPVIGMHIRLGDKSTEYLHDSEEMGITNEFGNLTVYLEAAHDAYRRLVSPEFPPLASTATSSRRFSAEARPTLLLMTAEPDVARRMADIPLAQAFDIVQTPPVAELEPVEGDEGSKKPKDFEADRSRNGGSNQGPKAYSVDSSSDGTTFRDGYTQATFNAMPLDKRVDHTRSFVRDLALLTGDEADALIVSGASNIGRLAMLIGGAEAVVGPRDSEDRNLGGRIRSIDAHFYPTSYPSSVYAHKKDLEDVENAAFIPTEQIEREERAKALKKSQKKLERERQGGKG